MQGCTCIATQLIEREGERESNKYKCIPVNSSTLPEHTQIVKVLFPYCQYEEQGEQLLWTLIQLRAAVYLPAGDGLTLL